jgi:hypothetical protein
MTIYTIQYRIRVFLLASMITKLFPTVPPGTCLHTGIFPNGKVTGPSYDHLPNFAGPVLDYFTEWAQFIQQNQSIPDLMSLHFVYFKWRSRAIYQHLAALQVPQAWLAG